MGAAHASAEPGRTYGAMLCGKDATFGRDIPHPFKAALRCLIATPSLQVRVFLCSLDAAAVYGLMSLETAVCYSILTGQHATPVGKPGRCCHVASGMAAKMQAGMCRSTKSESVKLCTALI